MIPWMRHVMALPNGYNLFHPIFFTLHTTAHVVYHITTCYLLSSLFFVAIAQFGGAIGGVASNCCTFFLYRNHCKFNILQYVQAKYLSDLIFCFFFFPYHGVKRVTKGKKPFKIDLTPFQEWYGFVNREHSATIHWFQQGVFLVAVVTVSSIAAIDDSLRTESLCGWFVLFHQLYNIIR